MANEIQLTVGFAVANGSFSESFKLTAYRIDQAAIGRGGGVQSVGTSEEVLASGDVSTLGWMLLRNLDATNYVEWGPESSGAMVTLGRIEAGEVALLRLNPGVVVRAKAHTAACKVDVRIYED